MADANNPLPAGPSPADPPATALTGDKPAPPPGSPPGSPTGLNGAPSDRLPEPASPQPKGSRSLLRLLWWRSAPTGAAPTGHGDGTREIVETVVFVVVLVLLLKSFTAEAFVIPTGSMAPTLYGYQMDVKCPTCDIAFPVNWSNEVEGGPNAKYIWSAVCPNCRQPIRFVRPDVHLPEGRAHPETPPGFAEVQIKSSDWGSGDRVLVAKFVYDLFQRDPDRLDVVVFKFPGESDPPTRSDAWPRTGPVKKQVPLNYIKRLLGLPGETIAIHRGKVYYLGAEHGLSYDDYEQAKGDPDRMARLWQKEHAHVDDGPALERFRKGEFEIVRKKPENVLAMMRLVYDNDHPAKDLTAEKWQRWAPAPATNWSPIDPHGFRASPEDDKNVHWLRYRHVLRDRLPEGEEKDGDKEGRQLITDFTGYNTGTEQVGGGFPGPNWASDLVLECEAVLEGPGGDLLLEVSKGADRFRAAFDLTTGKCTLQRLVKGKPEDLGPAADTPVRGKGTYRLRLANVDDKLTLWVDNRLPFAGGGLPYKGARDFAPTRENDLERPASIGVKGAKVTVRKIKLFRDTYYTCKGSEPDVSFKPRRTSALDELAEGKAPVATFYVQPGHYLCMGDNSPQSSDGRAWGMVPKRLMLGKALLVYYPFSRAGRIR